MNMNNFIALTPNDIIIYNHIQSKIYKYFISHHKTYNFTIDDNANANVNDNANVNANANANVNDNVNANANVNDNANDDKKYCKNFKFNVCLCYRNKNNIKNYSKIYNCPNNKRILYNINNFNFLNPISISINDKKIYPIDIFTYYRQEYLPFIINEEFNKYKNNQMKLKNIHKNKLMKTFNIIKNHQNNYHFLKYNFNIFKETLKLSLNEIHKNKLMKTFNIIKNHQNNYHFLKYNFNIFKETLKLSLNKKLYISYNNDYNNNTYYNDLIDVFNNNSLNTTKTISTQTEEDPKINYSLIIAIILNDYTNLIGDYNDFIISLLKY